jgi:outer membrane protein assembly factor BamA
MKVPRLAAAEGAPPAVASPEARPVSRPSGGRKASGRRFAEQVGRVVPFYYQQTLGGNHTLRSYPIFRFRGTRRLAVSAEYRFGLLRFLELAAFYDGGDISGAIEALGSQGYRDSVGASVRWVSKKDVILRVFGAYGSEGWRFSGAGAFPF